MTSISSFRDLRVWQQGVDLVGQVYRISQSFPKHEIYGLSSQMRRAAVSVPANVAEGHIRKHTKAFLNHLSIALGSLAELQTELEIAVRLGYVSSEQASALDQQGSALARQLHSLRNALPKVG
jgi:four helix bundle protein